MGFSDIIKKVRASGDEEQGGWRGALKNFGTSMLSNPGGDLSDRLMQAGGAAAVGAIADRKKKKKLQNIGSEGVLTQDGAILNGINSMYNA